MNENKHLEEREIIIPYVKLALCFTEAKTTLLSFKGKENINLERHRAIIPSEQVTSPCSGFSLFLKAKA